ncbi:Centrosomal protein of 76 kDa [Trebouxia sp. C0010 RCD-2024]
MSTGGSNDPPLPPDKLNELRKAVKEQLKSLGVNDQIKSLVAEKRKPIKGKEPGITKEQAIEELKGRGVMEAIVKSLNQSDIVEGGSFTNKRQSIRSVPRSAPVPAAPAPAFETSVLIELPGGNTTDPSTLLTHKHPLHLVLLQVQPAAVALTAPTPDAPRLSPSPSTSSPASIGINSQQHSSGGDPAAASTAQPGPTGHLHAANLGNAHGAMLGSMARSVPNAGPAYFLTATSAEHAQQQGPARAPHPLQSTTDLLRCSSRTTVIGTCRVDWRQALACKAEASCIVQLAGPQLETVGHISLDLEVAPALPKPVESAALTSQTEAEGRRDMEASTGFRAKLQEWWQEYRRDALSLQPEGVMRLTASGEDGRQRSCCAFVRPLQLGRSLSTPREAARFVALLTLKQGGGGADEVWSSLHTVLEACQASQTEKALLLASLLLGYGLDAWVVFGTDAIGQHTWVLTRSSREDVVFWDACTGSRYSPATAGQPKGCPFRSIACAFNQRRLYANLQAADGLAAAGYVFEDAARWRELAVHAHDIPSFHSTRFDLQVHTFDTAAYEAKLEAELKRALTEHREESLGHTPTHWDEGMAFLLMPSLAAYEQEAVTGQPAAGNDDFQQCLRRSIPAGCMFKGFPQHHRTLSPSGIVQGMLKEATIRDILKTQMTDISFALRLKVFMYPEQVCSVWLMLAFKYSTARTARISKQDL